VMTIGINHDFLIKATLWTIPPKLSDRDRRDAPGFDLKEMHFMVSGSARTLRRETKDQQLS
jgi:hypothetical protein